MRFLFRLIPFLLGLVTLAAFVTIAFAPPGTWWWLLLVPCCFGYGLFELLGRRWQERDVWLALLLALVFAGSGAGFFLSLEDWPERMLVALAVTVLEILFIEQLYRWFYGAKVPSYTLGVMVALLEIFTVFFLASDLIGLRIFLRVSVWLLTLIFMVAIAALYVTARAPLVSLRSLLVPALALACFFGELFWSMLFLPSGFMVGAAGIALVWYTIAGLLRVADLGMPLAGPAKRYLILASCCMVLVALTARWF